MPKFTTIAVILAISCLILCLVASLRDEVYDFKIQQTRERLQIIADTTLLNKEAWEPMVSEDSELSPDIWGTEIRLLYLKVPEMTISLALSAGPDRSWDTVDDLSAVAFRSDDYSVIIEQEQ